MNALDLFYAPLALVTAPWWARKPRAGWGERFGHSPEIADRPEGTPPRPRLLLHAVSVGEVSALRELVPALERDAQVVLSATTDTGLARARDLFAGVCDVVRYPLDFSWSVRRFLEAVRPDAVGLVELELWPNFVRACVERGVPVAVINGRLSERSFRGYRRVRAALRPTFARLALAAVQDGAYAARFIAMGVPADRCTITGSMKWDSARIADDAPGAAALARDLGIDRSRPLIAAGSTAQDEEALLHTACPPGVQLLCAPRKPEHFDDAAASMPGCRRRSRLRPGTAPGPGNDRFLLDTIGELRSAYALADVVVMGRSFGSLHGSDPIEPAALGKPVIVGPRMGDFASITQTLLDAGAILQVDRGSLASTIESLIRDPARRADLAQRARACIRANQGATERHRAMLIELVCEACKSRASRSRRWDTSAEPAQS
jgi:3-deoxy-D-manno-octulosonic-acid transferase